MKRICFYRTCPLCGAHLDPGESCTDCKKDGRTGMTEQEARFLALIADFSYEEKLELLRFIEMLNNGLEVTEEEAYEMGRQMSSLTA